MSTADRIAQQKKQLKKTLELMEGLDDLSNDLIEDRDLMEGEAIVEKTLEEDRELSSREKTMLKRKNKTINKVERSSSTKKTAKLDLDESELFLNAASENVVLRTLLTVRSNVLNTNWTVRHGALLGIKTLAKPMSESKSAYPLLLLMVLARNVLAVLGLDRFGDFVGDQTIAPVRETAAQCLTIIFLQLKDAPILQKRIWHFVLIMAQYRDDWQVRHSGLLCIKYLSAVDRNVFTDADTFTTLTTLGLAGCEDGDEDIRALSAELLERLCAIDNPPGKIDRNLVFGCAVSVIRDVDDDSSVGGAILVHALSLIRSLRGEDKNVIFSVCMRLRHPMSKVREGALDALAALVGGSTLSPTELILLFRLLVQCIVLDDLNTVRSKSEILLKSIIPMIAPSRELLAAYVSVCSILLTPREKPYEERHFVFVESCSDEQGIVTTSKPAAHEIGFKASDVMIQSVSVSARRIAARPVALISKLYDASVQQKISTSLVADDALSQCVGWWLFGSNYLKSAGDAADDIWDLRKWSAFRLALDDSANAEALIRLIGMEDETPLQEDAAILLKKCDPCIELLSPIVSKETRCNALKVFEMTNVQLPGVERMEFQLAKELVSPATTLPTDLLLATLDSPDESIWESDLVSDLFVALSRRQKIKTIDFLIETVLPMMKSCGRLERSRILTIVKRLFSSNEHCEYAALFLIPVLGRIADSEETVRMLASGIFGELVQLVPLSRSLDVSQHSNQVMMESQKAESFLAQFMGDSPEDLLEGGHGRAMAIPEYDMSTVEIRAELRPYQKAGVNWLAFLCQFGLNGALCDDMGLGKTLQTICMLACDQSNRVKEGLPTLPSLVVCPASLVGHWHHEVMNYAPSLGEPLLIYGAPVTRRNLWKGLTNHRIVVTSYEVLRSDIHLFSQHSWSYAVLDEGHVIKNPKTKLTQAVKMIRADHRLILSGTPIQNNVGELWSLFDFLMPGMLGDEAQFMERYGKSIMAVQPSTTMGAGGNKSNAGAKEFEEADRKLKALHTQVLPFLLRRMKEHVLKDLPPKIIQDYECDLSEIQRILYDDLFNDAQMAKEVIETLHTETEKKGMHVFQALQYLRKICVHPAMVLTNDHPLRDRVQKELDASGVTLDDLAVSPKLLLLKELLEECGLGADGEDELNGEEAHRVLIFAQQKSTLDLIERLVFKKHMAHLQFLRLDGSVEQRARFDIAQRFNSDPTIGALLLTTQVGGLGLNLTGADTVIFVEHDWNPMRDLQAMDRAHRLGQKRVVNVYRLVLRDTLEQQILGLQRWKTKVAATVVQQQGEERVDLLELLAPSEKKTKTESKPSEATKWLQKHAAVFVDDEQMDKDEYSQSFNVDEFTKSLNQ
ncbi:hypothetical protein PSACC_01180 [Paramicrosporidium saccamoebae]|uniref:Uncharacterized protein n=1 Tax=Paramicrosporidium saccamoebae TaxID=1246581 RepID=A0A2H9TMN4_9FUNG|nr:hypothetical protein PSACC_01180 [Paramicrosporidium saccamoebae]